MIALTDFEEDDIQLMYLTYTGASDACMTLGGRDRLARYIQHDWEVSGCSE